MAWCLHLAKPVFKPLYLSKDFIVGITSWFSSLYLKVAHLLVFPLYVKTHLCAAKSVIAGVGVNAPAFTSMINNASL